MAGVINGLATTFAMEDEECESITYRTYRIVIQIPMYINL